MSGTVEGGRKAGESNKKNDPDFYSRIGTLGGAKKNKAKGFGSASRAAHLAASSRGGTKSKRGKWSVDEYLARARYYANKQEQRNKEARGEA